MPRAVQTLNHSSSSSRMPDSSTGTSPRAQPAKPFRLGHRPVGWLERRRARGGGQSQLSPAHRQLFSASDKSSEVEDVENYEELKTPVQSAPSELESAINGHLHGILKLNPEVCASKIEKDIQPVQRIVKVQKEENEFASCEKISTRTNPLSCPGHLVRETLMLK